MNRLRPSTPKQDLSDLEQSPVGWDQLLKATCLTLLVGLTCFHPHPNPFTLLTARCLGVQPFATYTFNKLPCSQKESHVAMWRRIKRLSGACRWGSNKGGEKKRVKGEEDGHSSNDVGGWIDRQMKTER